MKSSHVMDFKKENCTLIDGTYPLVLIREYLFMTSLEEYLRDRETCSVSLKCTGMTSVEFLNYKIKRST